METRFDVSELARELGVLHLRGKRRTRFVAVLPLAEGKADVVRELLAEGPPFDPEAIGLKRHEVFLTEREAVFFFEAEEGAAALERILAEPELWEVVSAWEHCAAEPPRFAELAFEWPERRRAPEG